MAIMIQNPGYKYNVAILSLAFAYSPWATFGVVPYAIADFLCGKNKLLSKINIINIAIPTLVLIIFGSFYSASSGSAGAKGFIFAFHPGEERRLFCSYLVFILFEFGIYLLVMGIEARKYMLYWVTVCELLIFPLLIVRDGNFIMRGSIPALFMLMCYAVRYLSENNRDTKFKIKKRILIGVICIGTMTPLAEVDRTLQVTTASDNVLQEQIGSFGNMKTQDEFLINTAKNQFFIYNYKDSIFFKYLAHNK